MCDIYIYIYIRMTARMYYKCKRVLAYFGGKREREMGDKSGSNALVKETSVE